MKVLSNEQVLKKLGGFRGWETGLGGLRKTFPFPGFAQALEFVNKVGLLAESQNHHPEIDIRFNLVTFNILSHEAGGITERDFRLAKEIDTLAMLAA